MRWVWYTSWVCPKLGRLKSKMHQTADSIYHHIPWSHDNFGARPIAGQTHSSIHLPMGSSVGLIPSALVSSPVVAWDWRLAIERKREMPQHHNQGVHVGDRWSMKPGVQILGILTRPSMIFAYAASCTRITRPPESNPCRPATCNKTTKRHPQSLRACVTCVTCVNSVDIAPRSEVIG